ncbi:MAG: glutathione S-transferase family protein [Pseudomonadota bacterium]
MAVVSTVCLALGLTGLLWFLRERSRRRVHPVTGGIDRSTVLPHTGEVELYSTSFSHCSRKVRLALEELGISVSHHSIELIETGWYQTISPAYLKVNPSGLIPTLVHQGHPVFESDDILLYAQSIAGTSAPVLTPEDPGQRAQMQHWLDFCTISSADAMAGMALRAGACIPGLTLPMFVACIQQVPPRRILVGLLFHFDRKRPVLFVASKLLGLRRMLSSKPVRTLMHGSRDAMGKHLRNLNAELYGHGQPWILGERYSLADITLACLLLRLEETGWLRWFEQNESIPEVTQYYQRLKARPAWARAIVNHQSSVVARAENTLRDAVNADPELAVRIYGDPATEAHRVRGQTAW